MLIIERGKLSAANKKNLRELFSNPRPRFVLVIYCINSYF